jgi:hypothetical protein
MAEGEQARNAPTPKPTMPVTMIDVRAYAKWLKN